MVGLSALVAESESESESEGEGQGGVRGKRKMVQLEEGPWIVQWMKGSVVGDGNQGQVVVEGGNVNRVKNPDELVLDDEGDEGYEGGEEDIKKSEGAHGAEL